MDRALKERIIGAAVLVAFAVLVVPVFLDGPSADGGIVTESVRLPGQGGEEETRTVVLERDREEPVPAAVATSTPATRDAAEEPVAEKTNVAATPTPPPPDPVPAKPQQQAAAKPATSATGMWAVQLGSFGNQQNAERLAADLRKQGFAAFLSMLPTDGGELHRVRIGPQKDRESAEAMATRLDKAGYKGQVVPHP